MKPGASTNRHRFALTVAAILVVGAALTAPFFIDATKRDLTLHSAAVIAATRDSYTLTSPITLPSLPNVTLESGTLSVTDATKRGATNGAAVLALLNAGTAKLVLDEALLSMQTGPSSPVSGTGEVTALAPVLMALLNLSFAELELRNSSVRLGRSDGSAEILTNVAFAVTKPRDGEARAAGTFTLRGKQVSFDSTIATSLQPRASEPAPGRAFTVAVKSDLMEFKATGVLATGEKPQFTASKSSLAIKDVRAVARWLGVNWASGQGLGPFEAQGPLEVSPRSIAFSDATFLLDGNKANGTLTFKWAGKRPAFDGTLAFANFDLSPYALTTSTTGNPLLSLSEYLVRSQSEAGIFPLLDQLDADLRISATQVVNATSTLGKGAASVSLKDGVLLADIAEIEIPRGGRCGGQLGIEVVAGTPTFTLRGKIEQIDLAQVSNAVWSYGAVSGQGDVTLDISAWGATATQLLATMKGKAALKQKGPGLIGIDLKTLAATTRTKAQKGWRSAARGYTVIDGLDAQFTLADGQMIAKSVVARAGDAALSADGRLGLTERNGDFKVWITHPVAAGASNKSTAASSSASPIANSAAPRFGPGGAPLIGPTGTGGALHFIGGLDAPDIRFIPLGELRDDMEQKSRQPDRNDTPAGEH